MVKELLLQGKLYLPSRDKFIQAIGEHYTDLTDLMFTSLWHHYLINKGTTSLVYWSDRFNNEDIFNTVIIALSKANWIISHVIPARNWAEISLNENKLLEFVSQEQLDQIRAYYKFNKYISREEESYKSTSTKLNGKVQNTGISREGFMLAGNTQYKYDITMMSNYTWVLQRNLTKSMDKIKQFYPQFQSDNATYDTISCNILDFHIANDITMTRGNNLNDSRGRAISNALTKVFNPISNKDARSLLVIQYED